MKILLRPFCFLRGVGWSLPNILQGSHPISGHLMQDDWPELRGDKYHYPGKCMTCGLYKDRAWSDELLQPYDDPSMWKEAGKKMPLKGRDSGN